MEKFDVGSLEKSKSQSSKVNESSSGTTTKKSNSTSSSARKISSISDNNMIVPENNNLKKPSQAEGGQGLRSSAAQHNAVAHTRDESVRSSGLQSH